MKKALTIILILAGVAGVSWIANEVMVPSAGPNKVWENNSVTLADDPYRCGLKEK